MKRSRNSAATPAAKPWLETEEDEELSMEQALSVSAPAQGPLPSPPVELFTREGGDLEGNSYAEYEITNGAAIVRNIASFLTLSDAASLASGFHSSTSIRPHAPGTSTAATAATEASHHQQGYGGEDDATMMSTTTPGESWAVGIEFDHHSIATRGGSVAGLWSVIETPLTPPLMAISPGATPAEPHYHPDAHYHADDDDFSEDGRMQHILRVRTRRWAQEKLTKSIFSHPGSLRSFCLEAYAAAQQIRAQQQLEQQEQLAKLRAAAHVDEEEQNPETRVYPTKSQNHQNQHHVAVLKPKRKRKEASLQRLLHSWIDLLIFENIPLSVVLDLLHATRDLSLDTTWASLQLTHHSLEAVLSALVRAVTAVWDTTTHIIFQHHPGRWLEAIRQSNAVEVTSGALKSGFHSVAHNVGHSASNLAMIQRWSAANLSSSGLAVGAGVGTNGDNLTSVSQQQLSQQLLLDKLSELNDAARVLAYQEVRDDTGGLTQHALSRARRMMHYSVSLRPFVATVAIHPDLRQQQGGADDGSNYADDNDDLTEMGSVGLSVTEGDDDNNDNDKNNNDEDGSFFMCTPQSFPPTPRERQMVMMKKSRVSNDVIFSARDKLRLHDALSSEDERTRQFAKALEDTKSLATFYGRPSHENDIELSCGRNIATKKGSTMYYSNTRSMVPLWRNSHVYFEITVLPHVSSAPPIAVPTLSIGLSSDEMPPNTLVGALQGSVGLCSTGQILLAGQWYTPARARGANHCASYSDGSTVGCLVCLDDETAFETWDGVMITAGVTFSVNGHVVPPCAPVSNIPNSGNESHTTTATDDSISSSASCSESSSSTAAGPIPTTVSLVVPTAEDVFPTVTLQSASTAVLCRFSSGDILASSRKMIGAPPDVPIYAVDGSVLFSG